jgi:hypothetical protein
VVSLGGLICTISIDCKSTVSDVKAEVEKRTQIPVREQRFFVRGNELSENDVVNVCLKGSSSLTMVRRDPEQAAWLEGISNMDVLRWNLSQAPADIRDDREVVLAAVCSVGSQLSYASQALRDDRELALIAVIGGWRLSEVSEYIRDDRDIVLAAITVNHMASQFSYASQRLRDDRDLALLAVQGGWSLSEASYLIRNDREVVLVALRSGVGSQMIHASTRLRGDRQLALIAATKGWDLSGASDEVKDDKEIVAAGISSTRGMAFEYASRRLKGDRVLLQSALERGNPDAFEAAAEELRQDKSIVLVAVRHHPNLISSVPSEFLRDREVVLTAIEDHRLFQGEITIFCLCCCPNSPLLVLHVLQTAFHAHPAHSSDGVLMRRILASILAWESDPWWLLHGLRSLIDDQTMCMLKTMSSNSREPDVHWSVARRDCRGWAMRGGHCRRLKGERGRESMRGRNSFGRSVNNCKGAQRTSACRKPGKGPKGRFQAMHDACRRGASDEFDDLCLRL